MGTVTGSELLAQALKTQGVEALFFVMGGPMLETEAACINLGIRAIDARHEQAASFEAHAWTRVMRRPAVCMGGSGPGTTNLLTGIATAFTDASPLVAIGGSSSRVSLGMETFQEIDQLSIMKPVTKWAVQVRDTRRIPEIVATAFRRTMTARQGPVYIDMPADVLKEKVPAESVVWPAPWKSLPRPLGDPAAIREAIALLRKAERPFVLGGSGIWWSDGAAAFQVFVEAAGIPFFTTPMSRGSVPEDHPLSFLGARSTVFREADVIVSVGTRFNWITQFGLPPRFDRGSRVIRVDADPTDMGHNRHVDVPIIGDARSVLGQLAAEAEGNIDPNRYSAWVNKLRVLDARKRAELEEAMSTDQMPIHPLRLCKEVRDFIHRDAILVVDGHEILSFGRQSIPTFLPGHRLNSGAFGCMGVGLPYGIGVKVAKPDKQVLVIHGDGSFGINAMEIDTAVRHRIPIICVISNNGGWTADTSWEMPLPKPGRHLGRTRYDLLARDLGAHGEFVEKPQEIRLALDRAAQSGKPAVVNIMTDDKAEAQTVRFFEL